MGRLKINPDIIKKECLTCKKEFEVSYYLRNRQVYCSRSCKNHDINIINRMKDAQVRTFNHKYGCHPMKTIITKERLKKAMKEKYGVEYYSQSAEHINKVRKTKLIRYGNEKYTNIDLIKKTLQERYGVDNIHQYKDVREKIIKTKRDKHYKNIIEYCNKNELTAMFNREGYKGYKFQNKYKFKCNKCNYIFESSINNTINNINCEKCYPYKKHTLENEFFEYIISILPGVIIKRNDRTILHGKELDIYVPEKKIAFELNGLYWHSENSSNRRMGRHYHLNKTKGCLHYGIRLIHIYESEWRDKKEIIKSIIKNILKLPPNNYIDLNSYENRDKYYISKVSNQAKIGFLTENNLFGNDISTINLGLYYQQELVSILTLIYRNKKWSISRYCDKINIKITGSIQKFIEYIRHILNIQDIIYVKSDRRIFSGDIYLQNGFLFSNNILPDYYYVTPDYKFTTNKMKFQKKFLRKELTLFNEDLTEWENMKNNGWDRLWNCGYIEWKSIN